MELIALFLVPVVMLWLGLAVSAALLPALAPLYRSLVRLCLQVAIAAVRWLWMPGAEQRGGGRIQVPWTDADTGHEPWEQQ